MARYKIVSSTAHLQLLTVKANLKSQNSNSNRLSEEEVKSSGPAAPTNERTKTMAGGTSGDALCGGNPPFGPTETPRNDAPSPQPRQPPAAAPAALVSAGVSSNSCNVLLDTHRASPPCAIVASNRDASSRLVGLSEGQLHQVHELHEGAPPRGVTTRRLV